MNNSREKFESWLVQEIGEHAENNDKDMVKYLNRNVDIIYKGWQAATEQSQKEIAELEACLHEIVNKSFTTYKAKNGKEVGIEDDSGEMCYIVPHEPIISAEHLVKSKTSELMVKVLHLAKDEMSKYKKG